LQVRPLYTKCRKFGEKILGNLGRVGKKFLGKILGLGGEDEFPFHVGEYFAEFIWGGV
jgi:hypothetical protein